MRTKYLTLRPADWAQSNPALAARLGTTAHAVSAARCRYTDTRLPTGPPPSVSAEQAKWAVERWEAGEPFKVSGAALGVSAASVRRAIRRAFGDDAIRRLVLDKRRRQRWARLDRERRRRNQAADEWCRTQAERQHGQHHDRTTRTDARSPQGAGVH